MGQHRFIYNLFILNYMNPCYQMTSQYYYLCPTASLTPLPLWGIYDHGRLEHPYQTQFSVTFCTAPFQQTSTPPPQKDTTTGQAIQNQQVSVSPASMRRRIPRRNQQKKVAIQEARYVKIEEDALQNQTQKYVDASKTIPDQEQKPKNRVKNKNRNIIPNVVQQTFSYLAKPTKSKPVIQKALSLMESSVSCEVSIQRYYSFIKQIKDKLNHYLDEKSLQALCKTHRIGIELYSSEEQGLYLKIARIAAKQFMDNHLPRLIIHSKRMYLDKRIEHLRVRRVLTEVLQGLHCQLEC